MDVCKLKATQKLLRGLAIIVLATVGLNACGGGGDGVDDGGGGIIGTGYIQGTVGSERMLAESGVSIKAAGGERTIATIGNDGRFAETAVIGDSPYLMRVDLGNGNYRYSIGHKVGDGTKQNIHSYTDATARNWFAQNGQNIDSVFDSEAPLSNMPTAVQYADAFNALTNIVGPVTQDYNLAGVDLATVDFTANDTGVDAFLNQNPVIINNGQITIIINDPNSNTQSIATDNLSLGTDLLAADTTPPSTPDSVRVLQASVNEVVVVWEPASDNIGVSSYQLLRDGVLVETTPYPVYTDTGLTAGSDYSYSIVAVDAAGNESSATIIQMITLTAETDTTAPPAPTSLQTSATAASVSVEWQQTDINDVALFEVQRGTDSATPAAIASVTSTFFTDASTDSGTQYCYIVVAIDSAGNRSPASNTECATTSGTTVITTAPPVNTSVNIAFATSNYSVSENSGSVSVNVSRTGTAATSVDYTVVGNTATNGEDFTATSGTLTWAEGDNSSKTISVQINSDSQSEADETISVILSNASGNGVITGSEASITITDVDPIACTTEFTPTRIDENITTNPGCYLVNTDISVNEGANLTLSPGTTLKFASGHGIRVNTGGSLTSEGTAAAPILLTGQDQTPGYWDGVELVYSNSIRNSFVHTTIEYGGSGTNGANLELRSLSTLPSRVSATNSTFRHSIGYGINIGRFGILDDFENNTLTQNDGPINLDPVLVSGLSASSNYTGNTEDKIYIDGTTVSDAASWAKLGVPYSVGDLNLNAALTIAAGTRMEFRSTSQLRINTDGALIAVGTQAEPITFTSSEQTTGFWDGINFVYSGSPQNKLEHVIIEYGGTAANGDALINASSLSSNPVRLSMNNVTLRNSIGDGFSFNRYTTLSQFDNIISTSNERPGVISIEMIPSLGTGLAFTGNQSDIIYAINSSADESGTWLNHGVPYSVDDLTVSANLTIGAGVQMLMRSSAEIFVNTNGTLAISGTAAQPVDIRGEQPVAGYWQGLRYQYSNNNNVIDHATITYGGGGTPGTSGNIELSCLTTNPSRVSISNTAINDSGGWGIYTSNNCLLTVGTGVTYSNNSQGNLSP